MSIPARPNPITQEMRTSPECNGVLAKPSWRYTANVNSKPAYVVVAAACESTPHETAGSASTDMFKSGSPPDRLTRRSTSTNAPKAGMLAANEIHVQAGHPASRPIIKGTATRTIEGERVATPRKSSRRAPRTPGSRGSRRSPSARSTIPIGTLIRKIGRHWLPAMSAEISAPPSACPAAAPPASAAEYKPTARTRSTPLKCSWIALRTWGTIMAAPAPCTSLEPARNGAEGAKPHASDASVKQTTPARNMFE